MKNYTLKNWHRHPAHERLIDYNGAVIDIFLTRNLTYIMHEFGCFEEFSNDEIKGLDEQKINELMRSKYPNVKAINIYHY